MTSLREHQMLMLQMLKEIDRICHKHNIQYSLFAGTMLGAVREKGFIEWDDDLDIIMKRDEYERFLEIADSELDKEQFYLQKEFGDHWPMFFTKLRKNNTTCIERYIPKDEETHLGVFIDIFPLDNLNDLMIVRKCQFLTSKIVIAKALDKRGYLTDSIIKKMFMLLCRIIPDKGLINFVRSDDKNDTRMMHSFFASASKYEKNIFKREWLEETVLMEFEGEKFPVYSRYDEILTVLYGDYNTPTPVEKRGAKVHGQLVDVNKSYVEYKGIQKEMVFAEKSESIR